MTADLANDACDLTSLPPAKTESEKRGRGGSNAVHINEGTNPPLTTRRRPLEVSSSTQLLAVQRPKYPPESAPPMPPSIPEGYFPYFMPGPSSYFQGADGQNGAPPVQVPFYSYHQLAPFPYPTGIPMPFMQPIPGQPGPSHHPIEPPQPLSARGGKRRSSTDELSTPKRVKTDDQQTDGTPDVGRKDASPPTDSTPQPSKPPSTE